MIERLIERFKIEQRKKDRSGIYAVTQRELAYNSNKIEGSTLTKEQTASLFDTGMVPQSDDYYRAKDIEEMNGHFLMFRHMVNTLEEPLSEKLIKELHYELKAGVFEDRANGYAVGDYKKRANIIGMYETAKPESVAAKMRELLEWYEGMDKDLSALALFHAKYESVHPFQDGNGRTGRIIIFRECLVNRIVPLIIEDSNRKRYIDALGEYRQKNSIEPLVRLFKEEQEKYREKIEYFL
ncbi:MAG: Fic family protein [Lachnospiraceae bacterium]|nr:Fic family protein [Lachnospiraceae bacterium]